MARTLTSEEARLYYEKNAVRQDHQGWYEDAALERLLEAGEFEHASSVLEVGCGSGILAERLIAGSLDSGAKYVGLDIARSMLERTRSRLDLGTGVQASLIQADATQSLPIADGTVDRLISAYVLDLMSDLQAARILAEAHRVLIPGGVLCLASLTRGPSGLLSGALAGLWSSVQRLFPKRVGGCRPVALSELVSGKVWSVRSREIVAPYGLASEIVIASRR